jgi:aldehyde:ferredoxin oxidoreductase
LPDLESQLDEYYRFRGWTENGVPTEETLAKLGLERLQG